MPYTVFKNNNNLITAPNETGEIVLDTSISRQIRIEVNHNTYQFYDIAEKKYLTVSNIISLNIKRCFFTAIIYPCSSVSDPEVDIRLVANKDNYPIVYKFVNSCLGSEFNSSYITNYNGMYCSNNIYINNNSDITKPISIEFEFQLGVKMRLNINPSGLQSTSFSLTSDNVEIISLFQHNISIEASRAVSGVTNYKYLHSLSFSFINNRYRSYTENTQSVKNQVLSLIQDLPEVQRYPASGLLYKGSYSNGSSTMSIMIYTIRYIYSTGSALNVVALYTDKGSASTSIATIDATNESIIPSQMARLSLTDHVIPLS